MVVGGEIWWDKMYQNCASFHTSSTDIKTLNPNEVSGFGTAQKESTLVFLGEYQAKFTGQGRVILPRKFRQGLPSQQMIVLSRGFEGCIWGFSVEDFQKEAEKQLTLILTEETGRQLRRYFFSAAESVTLDSQGRFVIPGGLLEYADLQDEAIIVGAGDHFEIWNPKGWQKLIKKLTYEKSQNST